MFSFKDQVILITGASRGVGAATAIKFAEAGAAGIVINYHRNYEAARSVSEAVKRAGATPLIAQADISRTDEAISLVRQSEGYFGRLDVVVANAGVWPAKDHPITELGEMQWEETLRVNLSGVYYICREAARIFMAQGHGKIVTVSSTAGQRGEAGHADYAASKGAVISFTKSLAVELGRYNVRVNCVAPGWIETEMAAPALHASEAQWAQILGAIPLGRVAASEDVAGPILFLASDFARHITGEVLNVNGGAVLCG